MSTFERSGHWRTSKYGVVHWVSSHIVSRDDWWHSGPSYDTYRSLLGSSRASGSSTARFVNPNATCPICGADVFYYQNEFGSRVFFDEIGPPWPKHPCADSGRLAMPGECPSANSDHSPVVRTDAEIQQILNWTERALLAPEEAFRQRYGASPWRMAELLKRIRGAAGTLLILRDLTTGESKKHLLMAKSLPRSLRAGAPVALRKSELSFLDVAAIESRTVEVTRIRSATAFIDAIVDPAFEG